MKPEHALLMAFKDWKMQLTKDNSAKVSNVNLQVSYLAKMLAKLEPRVPDDVKSKYGPFAIFASPEAHKTVLEEIKSAQGSSSGKLNYM